MALPKKLQRFADQPGAAFGGQERRFVEALGEFLPGVGFGFAQQVIEWMWQEWAEAKGLPGSAWGPEYFEARDRERGEAIGRLEARVLELLAACRQARSTIVAAVLGLMLGEKPTTNTEREINRVVDLLNAAIAGAEGEG